MSDLFDINREKFINKKAPLAARMRPKTLEEFIGQEKILSKGCLLRRAIEADLLTSVIFYGPPGSGKTTLAKIIANTTSGVFVSISAVHAGVGELREVIKQAKERVNLYQKRTILFIDEIHRFNKNQQDALLPAVEEGIIVLIGATTENPYFEVNRALLSRSRVFTLEALSPQDIKELLKRALLDQEKGLGNYKIVIDDEILLYLAHMSDGDARNAYNALELAVLTTDEDEKGIRHITKEIVAQSIQKPLTSYDKSGDNHYNVASAFIKSMRGGDPDAAIHYLARMIRAGEKPEFIARRILILAAEDVGLADPEALSIAISAANIAKFVGWPEARIPLAEAAIYMACAPKSNSAYLAIDKALADLDNGIISEVPDHLKDASYQGAKNLGHGEGYKYVHDYAEAFVSQQYLPEALKNTVYYRPNCRGQEAEIKARLDNWRKSDQNKAKLDKENSK
ncbi:MAG: replication-associated recombination protein A [Bacillota bacterium]|jgi:putative ATPase